MDLTKASEVYDFYLAEIEKAKYIKRTGSPGNYKYVYPGDEKKGRSGKKVVEKPASKITNNQESENGEKKMENYKTFAKFIESKPVERLTQGQLKFVQDIVYKNLKKDHKSYMSDKNLDLSIQESIKDIKSTIVAINKAFDHQKNESLIKKLNTQLMDQYTFALGYSRAKKYREQGLSYSEGYNEIQKMINSIKLD